MEWECDAGLCDQEGVEIQIGQTIRPYREKTLKQQWADYVRLCEEHKSQRFNDKREDDPRYAALEKPLFAWNDIVSAFSPKRLTVKADKLPAVAGIARHFTKQLEWTYVAGLGKEHIWVGLTWYRKLPGSPLDRHSDRAPSWTWASAVGMITYHRVFSANDRRGARKYLYVEPDFTLYHLEGERTIPGTSSESRLGKLTASGHIHKVTIAANVVK
jgi:hypothetical protein